MQINSNWTIFLDRDGVINEEINNDYVKSWEDFQFYPTTFEALKIINNLFPRIYVVTNQKGIGKGLYTDDILQDIHSKMLLEIQNKNGRIDDIFYAPDLDSKAFNRKPQIGMAIQAQQKYPEINFAESIMVGNKMSDMEFGKNAKMYTVFLNTTNPPVHLPHPLIDFQFKDLLDFAKSVKTI